MEIREEIITFIRRNRISTTEVADALGKSGVLPDLLPTTSELHKVGPVHILLTAHASNYAIHEQVREVQSGEIPIIFCHECDGRAIIGDLIAKYLLFYRDADALVVNGLVRDGARLKRERYPIWAKGFSPLGCYNKPVDAFPEDLTREIKLKYEGGVVVCDDGGVVIIPPESLNEDMLAKLQLIELQEDVWYYCLDTLKWDTKRIVCDKAYLTETNELPVVFERQMASLSRPLDKDPR